jgi:hypothetical protein
LGFLGGAKRLITRDRPVLYLENDRIDRSEELLSYVNELNYDVWWHVVHLFRKDNFARTQANIFGNISSFNILCIPKERRVIVNGLKKVENTTYHPLKR